MSITLKEVQSKKELKQFIEFPNALYSDNPYYMPALLFDEMNTLNPKVNPAFAFCRAKYWLALDGKEIVGRIAGIINDRYIQIWRKKCAQFGWIDFIDDPEVSKALFDRVESWALEHDMQSLQGPMGFTDFDKKGMLIEGFEELSCLPVIYNYPYYPKHLEKLGYGKEIDMIEMQIELPDTPPEKVARVAKVVEKKLKLQIVRLKKRKDIKPYVRDVFTLLNDSYKDLFGYVELSEMQMLAYTKQYFSFIHPEFVTLVYDAENHIAATGITMPSLTKAIQKSGGRLFPLGFIYLLRAMKKNDTADLYLTAVRKDLQDKGVNAILMNETWKAFSKMGIKTVEVTPMLETNKKILAQWAYYKSRIHKRRRLFSKKISGTVS